MTSGLDNGADTHGEHMHETVYEQWEESAEYLTGIVG
jgi:hypothetical protein